MESSKFKVQSTVRASHFLEQLTGRRAPAMRRSPLEHDLAAERRVGGDAEKLVELLDRVVQVKTISMRGAAADCPLAPTDVRHATAAAKAATFKRVMLITTVSYDESAYVRDARE